MVKNSYILFTLLAFEVCFLGVITCSYYHEHFRRMEVEEENYIVREQIEAVYRTAGRRANIAYVCRFK